MQQSLFVLVLATCGLSAGCQTPQQSQTIKDIGDQLQTGALSVTQVLTDPQWMPLHSLTAFRDVIKQNARAEKIKLTPPGEPGVNITVQGVATDREGQPIRDALVYVYHTSAKGWYADTAAHILLREGDMRHARLFGYLKTDRDGRFAFETIRPAGYPKSDLPAHIHIAVWTAGGQPVYGLPGELLFEEDERLTPDRRTRALEDGFLIGKNSGTEQRPVYACQLRQR